MIYYSCEKSKVNLNESVLPEDSKEALCTS